MVGERQKTAAIPRNQQSSPEEEREKGVAPFQTTEDSEEWKHLGRYLVQKSHCGRGASLERNAN